MVAKILVEIISDYLRNEYLRESVSVSIFERLQFPLRKYLKSKELY